MSIKYKILIILTFVMGIAFCAIGIYFLSQKFLNKLNEASPKKSEESFKHNSFRAKGSGYVSLSLGALTLIWGIFFILLPQIIPILALIYMIFLVAAFLVLNFVFK